VPSRETAIGSLIGYITDRRIIDFQPMNINFGLFPPVGESVHKSQKRQITAERALGAISKFYPY
jgi:methylenetetrahydrofolate--tRNA-(uracil-5-)-methyltransferase